MNAGKLRHRIRIERKSGAQNQSGQELEDWAEFCTIRADIDPQNGRERYLAQAEFAECNGVIEARYYPGVTAKMRAVFGTRILDIQLVRVPREIKQWMVLGYKEGLNNG